MWYPIGAIVVFVVITLVILWLSGVIWAETTSHRE